MLMTCLSYAGKPEGRSERRTDMKPMKEIYLAGGCFWGTEHFLKQIEGVEATQVGYANGNIANPTYQQVCTGTTDFAETVKVQYDPDEVDLPFLIDLYFKTIDPTSLNKQGGDRGTQYRTGIYYTDTAVLPANDPEILVYVMLDDPNNAHTDYSSILAAPVVGNIISEIAPYLGIATDGIDRSQNTVKVPNLVGKEWSNAQVSLNTKGLKHQLVESESDQTAAVVTYQYPNAGAAVASGTTIYLYTDTYSGSHTEVPDVSGKSADFARQMLTAAGLNCQVAGDSAGTVQSQSEAAGSSVQKGTVVTITCG